MGNENLVKLISLDTIPVQEVEWLVHPFIPCGKITIVQGDPGEGKTTFILQLIARLTTGRPSWEGMPPMTPSNVIYQTAEDGLSDTIKPRLLTAGAACDEEKGMSFRLDPVQGFQWGRIWYKCRRPAVRQQPRA